MIVLALEAAESFHNPHRLLTPNDAMYPPIRTPISPKKHNEALCLKVEDECNDLVTYSLFVQCDAVDGRNPA